MTEVTQADRDAAGKINLDLIAPEWAALYTAFARHREQAAAEERAKIVAWLRDDDMAWALIANSDQYAVASSIEAGEHLE